MKTTGVCNTEKTRELKKEIVKDMDANLAKILSDVQALVKTAYMTGYNDCTIRTAGMLVDAQKGGKVSN